MRIKDAKQIEARKKEILQFAKQIMEAEGIEALSIRKLATMMNQTPGIVYHYFDDKEAIIHAIIDEGFQGILKSLQVEVSDSDQPDVQLEKRLGNYINTMCEQGDLFLLLLNSKQKSIQAKVSILHEEALKRQSMQLLMNTLKQGINNDEFSCGSVEISAQWIWCATYGLIHRLVQEKPSEQLKQALIKQHIHSVIKAMRKETL